MTTRVLVSPEALTGLVTRLSGVAEELSQDVRPSAADVGQPELADALAEFSRNWGKRRREFVEDLREASQFLAGASEQFVARDGELARCVLQVGV